MIFAPVEIHLTGLPRNRPPGHLRRRLSMLWLIEKNNLRGAAFETVLLINLSLSNKINNLSAFHHKWIYICKQWFVSCFPTPGRHYLFTVCMMHCWEPHEVLDTVCLTKYLRAAKACVLILRGQKLRKHSCRLSVCQWVKKIVIIDIVVFIAAKVFYTRMCQRLRIRFSAGINPPVKI